jgi:adenine-specific DNA-methyltransferase
MSDRPSRGSAPRSRRAQPFRKPQLSVFATTLWEYPSQHYGDQMQGDKKYIGATPSWVIWQLFMRYTRENDLVVDPMCGSGTTIDVAHDLKRQAFGFDLAPSREDIRQADARQLPLEDGTADFVFLDPPYSTHIDYSDDPACIGKLDALSEEGGAEYYAAMSDVLVEAHRVLKDRRYLGLYVSDSFRKRKGPLPSFAPIGFELFAMMREHFKSVDIICAVRHNANLTRGNWRKAAVEENFFLRGFNYLFIMKKEEDRAPEGSTSAKKSRNRRKHPRRAR